MARSSPGAAEPSFSPGGEREREEGRAARERERRGGRANGEEQRMAAGAE
jgi:hypothetical protein